MTKKKEEPKKAPEPKMGAIYSKFKKAGQAAVPLTGTVTRRGLNRAGIEADLKFISTVKAQRDGLLKGYALAVGDAVVEGHRFIHHNQALGRKSVTAALPEVLMGWEMAEAGMNTPGLQEGASAANAVLARTTMGISPSAPADFSTKRPETRRYYMTKYVGAGVRMVANRTKVGRRISAPLKSFLSELGVGL